MMSAIRLIHQHALKLPEIVAVIEQCFLWKSPISTQAAPPPVEEDEVGVWQALGWRAGPDWLRLVWLVWRRGRPRNVVRRTAEVGR